MNMLLHRIEGARLDMAGNTLELHGSNVPGEEQVQRYPLKSAVRRQDEPRASNQLHRPIRLDLGSLPATHHGQSCQGWTGGSHRAEGVLFRGGPDAKVRKKLLEEFEVHTILSLPAGCFLPYTGVKKRPFLQSTTEWWRHQECLVLRADQ